MSDKPKTKPLPVLVTGGAGYIGSHVCKALDAAGFWPVVYDDFSSGHRHACKWGEVTKGDILDTTALGALFERVQPVAVMHFAARIEVGAGERNPNLFAQINVQGTYCLLDAMVAAGVNKIIFSSTGAVYGHPTTMPIAEIEPFAPASVYAKTKVDAENALREFSTSNQICHVIFRYFNAAGADPDGDIGEEHDPETHLIPNALAAAAGGDPLHVFGDDYPTADGSCIRDYIHVSDIARAHVLGLQYLLKNQSNLVANIGTGTGTSVWEVLAAVQRVTGIEVPRNILARRPGDVPVLVANTGFGSKKLGFEAKRSDIDQIIADAWAFYSKLKAPESIAK